MLSHRGRASPERRAVPMPRWDLLLNELLQFLQIVPRRWQAGSDLNYILQLGIIDHRSSLGGAVLYRD
jgi:hypothetical protein